MVKILIVQVKIVEQITTKDKIGNLMIIVLIIDQLLLIQTIQMGYKEKILTLCKTIRHNQIEEIIIRIGLLAQIILVLKILILITITIKLKIEKHNNRVVKEVHNLMS